jgi:glycosyltransferase involved in cell wall biosynthesis
MIMADSVTVFFPMYNEENNIKQAVDTAREVLDEITDDYEIIIVDDASTDATGPIADSMAREDPRIRVIHHETNRQLGGGLKTGFAAASKDLVLYSDADFPFDMMELKKAVRVIQHCDIVSAYRFDRTSEGYRRAIYSFCWNMLVRILYGIQVRDINFSFKLCRRSIFEHIRLKSESSFIDAELLIRANNLGYRIFQIGVDYFPRTRGVSRLSSIPVIIKMTRDMVRHMREIKRLRTLTENSGNNGGD